MKCPKCSVALETVVTDTLSAERCTNCEGIWIGPFSMEQLAARGGCQSLIQQLDALSPNPDDASPYYCPTCADGRLLAHQHNHVEIDWCPNCRGIYFDKGELNKFAVPSQARASIAKNDEGESSSALLVLGEILSVLADIGGGLA